MLLITAVLTLVTEFIVHPNPFDWSWTRTALTASMFVSIPTLLLSYFTDFGKKNFPFLFIIWAFSYSGGYLILYYVEEMIVPPILGLFMFVSFFPWAIKNTNHLLFVQLGILMGLLTLMFMKTGFDNESLTWFLRFAFFNVVVYLVVKSRLDHIDSLKDSNHRHLQILDNLNEGVIALDSNRKISYVNAAMKRLSGHQKEDIVGEHVLRDIPAEDHAQMYKRFMDRESGASARYPYQMPRKDGSRVWTQISASPIFNEAREINGLLALVIQDEEHQATLKQLNRKINSLENEIRTLQSKNRELEKFSDTVSTDLRGSISTIRSAYQSLQLQQSGGNEMPDFDFGNISTAILRMEDLLESVLLFSITDLHSVNLQPLDLNQILYEVEKSMEISLAEHKASLNFEELPMIHADRIQFLRLFRNLVENALMHRGEEEPVIHITHTEDPDNQQFVFAFEDNGQGIERDEYENIFRIFQREEMPEVREKGTGAGLAICKMIVNNHGGKLWFTSNAGKGTTFFFSIPYQPQMFVPPSSGQAKQAGL
ncbi:MAG: ATP-binding protein [Bacteroidota bacterium]